MKVLVTGATGFVGREVSRQLHGAAHEIHFLARRPGSASAYYLEWELKAQVHCGDILETKSLSAAMAGCDAVVHLVGIISEVGLQTYERVHAEGTRNMVAAARSAGVKRFIHMSALGTKPGAHSRYHQSKWAAEEAVRTSGLDWTIFRPSIVYGKGDGFVNLFARMSRFSPALPLIGGGRTKFQPVAVENVARCFVAALTEPRAVRETFDLTGNETLTLTEIVQTILKVTGRKRLKLPIPFGIAKVQAAFAEWLFGKLLGIAPPLNRDQVLMLRDDNVGDGRIANDLFALTHPRFEDAIARYLTNQST